MHLRIQYLLHKGYITKHHILDDYAEIANNFQNIFSNTIKNRIRSSPKILEAIIANMISTTKKEVKILEDLVFCLGQ